MKYRIVKIPQFILGMTGQWRTITHIQYFENGSYCFLHGITETPFKDGHYSLHRYTSNDLCNSYLKMILVNSDKEIIKLII